MIKLLLLGFIGSLFLYGCGNEEPTMIPVMNSELGSTEITVEGQETQADTVLSTDESDIMKEATKEQLLYVYISGAIENPGVYIIESETRLYQVIEAAGGFLNNASADSVNQARKVTDGEQIKIPTVEEIANGEVTAEESPNSGVLESSEDSLVNINLATKEQLCTIAGVGETRAESIILFREEHGDFKDIKDIMKIDGIKEGLFNKMKDKIAVK